MHFQPTDKLISKEQVGFSKDDRVLVKKGTPVRYRGEMTVAKKDSVVKVHVVFGGHRLEREELYRPPTFYWAGSGGYWKEASCLEVEKVETI